MPRRLRNESATVIESLEPRRLYAAGLVRTVTTDFLGTEAAADVVVQKDGRIVVLANDPAADGGRGNYFLARYAPDGSLDDTFGHSGRVLGGFDEFRQATSLAIGKDNRMVVAGLTEATGGAGPQLALARYGRGGEVDRSFGVGGLVTASAGDSARVSDVAVDKRGNVAVAGAVTPGGAAGEDVFVARFDKLGFAQTTFGGGVVTFDFERADGAASAVAFDKRDKVVVGGTDGAPAPPDSTVVQFGLARLGRDGSFDNTFGGGDGRLTFQPGRPAVLSDLTVLKRGQVLMAGNTVTGDVPDEQFVVAQFRPNGTPDPSFGRSGEGFTVSDFGAASQVAGKLAVDPKLGTIYLAGHVNDAPIAGGTGDNRFLLARYARDGAPDPAFGTGGAFQTEIVTGPGTTERVAGLGLQKGGRIVVAGTATLAATGQDLALARYAEELPPGSGRARLSGKTLFVNGTLDRDVVSVTQSADGLTIQVSVNGSNDPVDVYDAGDVRRVEVRGDAGDDEVTVSVDNADSVILGGGGNDILRVIGGGDGRIEGDDGDDQIFGGDGDDRIEGGDGDDRLFGGEGDDRFDEADGEEDDIDGGGGTDRAFIDRRDDTDDVEVPIPVIRGIDDLF